MTSGATRSAARVTGGIVPGVPETSSGHDLTPDGIAAGLVGRAVLVVSAADTALEMRSGDVEVLSTPRLLALCEEASMNALADAIPDRLTTVAVRVQINHLAPVEVGGAVRADATLERVDGRRLTFTLAAHADGSHAQLVGAGRLVRVLVDRAGFLDKAKGTSR